MKDKDKWYVEEFRKINKSISEKESLSLCDFHRIRNFKIRTLTLASEQEVEKITSEAFKLAEEDKIKEAIIKLCELSGVKIPMGSVILAMKFPLKYAIIDRHVVSALGMKEEWKKYGTDSKIYEDYILLLRKMAKDKEIENLRELELELFFMDKNKNEI